MLHTTRTTRQEIWDDNLCTGITEPVTVRSTLIASSTPWEPIASSMVVFIWRNICWEFRIPARSAIFIDAVPILAALGFKDSKRDNKLPNNPQKLSVPPSSCLFSMGELLLARVMLGAELPNEVDRGRGVSDLSTIWKLLFSTTMDMPEESKTTSSSLEDSFDSGIKLSSNNFCLIPSSWMVPEIGREVDVTVSRLAGGLPFSVKAL